MQHIIPESTEEQGIDWRAEAAKWKALARKHERRAKAARAALLAVGQQDAQ